jgi:hypothetical protein
LDFDQEDRLHQLRLSSQLSSKEDTTSSWDNLTTSSVDSISVEDDVHKVEADSSHVLVSQDSFLGNPLESSNNGILNFIEVLDSLSAIDYNVRSISVRSKAPDLSGFGNIPSVVFSQLTSTGLRIFLSINLSGVDGLRETLFQRLSNTVQSVVLVRGLRQANFAGLSSDSFTERDDRLRDSDWSTSHKLFLQILNADFQVQLSSTSNDVLSRFFNGTLDKRI